MPDRSKTRPLCRFRQDTSQNRIKEERFERSTAKLPELQFFIINQQSAFAIVVQREFSNKGKLCVLFGGHAHAGLGLLKSAITMCSGSFDENHKVTAVIISMSEWRCVFRDLLVAAGYIFLDAETQDLKDGIQRTGDSCCHPIKSSVLWYQWINYKVLSGQHKSPLTKWSKHAKNPPPRSEPACA